MARQQNRGVRIAWLSRPLYSERMSRLTNLLRDQGLLGGRAGTGKGPLKSLVKRSRAKTVRRLEELFFDICTVASPDLFVEAGAKDASTSRRARSHLPNARIVAFEANPYTYRRFEAHPDNGPKRVEYLNRALNDQDGLVTFNVRVIGGKPSGDGQSSLLARNSPSTGMKPVTVDASRLDSRFPSDSFSKAVMWVDVEGANKKVLTGAEGILPKVVAIFIEVEDRAFWDGQWLTSDVADYLNTFGLVEVGRDFQSKHQHNVLYVSGDLARSETVMSLISAHRRKARLGIRPLIWLLA